MAIIFIIMKIIVATKGVKAVIKKCFSAITQQTVTIKDIKSTLFNVS